MPPTAGGHFLVTNRTLVAASAEWAWWSSGRRISMSLILAVVSSPCPLAAAFAAAGRSGGRRGSRRRARPLPAGDSGPRRRRPDLHHGAPSGTSWRGRHRRHRRRRSGPAAPMRDRRCAGRGLLADATAAPFAGRRSPDPGEEVARHNHVLTEIKNRRWNWVNMPAPVTRGMCADTPGEAMGARR